MMVASPAITSAQTSKLSDEYGSFSLATSTSVSYGANGVFTTKTLGAGTYACGNSVFGDPLTGVAKSCYTAAAASSGTALTLLTAEFGTFKLASASTVSYGANGTMVQKSLAAGSYVCGNQLFGDPLSGVAKACYSTLTPAASSVSQLNVLVEQNSSFTLTAATSVTYGTGTQMVQKTLAAGTYQCSDALFGDPAVGIFKACYTSSNTTAATPAATTPVASKPVETSGSVLAVSGDVMVNGAVSNAEYQAMAQKMGTDAAIAYRYGPSSADYGTASQGGLPS
ncbi:MAG: hypothetical protein EOP70_08620, partial [Variovorax sp.]